MADGPDDFGDLSERIKRQQADTLNEPKALKCCCKNPNCQYLLENEALLEELEENVQTAAHLGQVRVFSLSLYPSSRPSSL